MITVGRIGACAATTRPFKSKLGVDSGVATYRSGLRRSQKEATRQRILDALARVMASGVAELSIPAVAREAEVSIPTVYRHFPNKRALLVALAPHIERKSGAGDIPDPTDLDSLADSTYLLFERLDTMDDVTRAAMASTLGRKLRREAMITRRRALIARALQTDLKTLRPNERERVINLILVLWSSASLRAFKDYLQLDANAAAEHVAWAIRALAKRRP
jgi:AcrR family transcriptional regulator